MLSYRHSFHAGNFADVIKHVVAVEILQSLGKKAKPFEYIDTHAGAGLYNLRSDHAQKLMEYKSGIGKLQADNFPELEAYFEAIKACQPAGWSGDLADISVYPGSPLIAAHFLRGQDRAWLHELHPKDAALLRRNTRNYRRLQVAQADGYHGLLSHLPPTARRAFVLIDPSYEVKSEYQQVVDTVVKAHRKFATGVYGIWYPVVDRAQVEAQIAGLKRQGIKDIQRFELGLRADSEERGMSASGMIVINPPWGLYETMSQLLPKLQQAICTSTEAFYRCEIVVKEAT